MHTRVYRQCFSPKKTASKDKLSSCPDAVFCLFCSPPLPLLNPAPSVHYQGWTSCALFSYLKLYKYVHGFYTVKCVFIVNIKKKNIETKHPLVMFCLFFFFFPFTPNSFGWTCKASPAAALKWGIHVAIV